MTHLGFVNSNPSISSFVNFFMSLEPKEETLMSLNTGFFHSSSALDSREKTTSFTLFRSKLKEEEVRKLETEIPIYQLSETGIQAFNIVVKVMSEQINK
jgi:hypothetical protein